jgi:hypothetical protein
MATPRRTFGRYELRGTLGEGGFATVYRAWDAMLERGVALKQLHPHLAANTDIRRRFLAEARALARLRHPNIVVVHEVGETDGRPFFTMELIEGRTLAELGARGPLPPAEVVRVIQNLAGAVDAMHAAGFVHRDVKAANVMVERSGRVVLMDFGIARTADATQHTRTGAVLGTLESIAPEQVRGLPAGPPADIYALGILTYQLLAGRPPFVGDTAFLLHAHVYDPPPPLRGLRPGLPPHVYAAVESALAKDPAQRPASAGRFAALLAGTAGAPAPIGDTPTVRTVRPMPLAAPVSDGRAAPPSRRGPLLLGVAIGAGALAGVALVMALVASGTGDEGGSARAPSRATTPATVVTPAGAGTTVAGESPSPSALPDSPPAGTPDAPATRTPMPATTTPTPPVVAEADAIRGVIERSHQLYIEALAKGGTAARLPEVYAGERLAQVTALVNRRRAAGEYHVLQRRAIEYRAVEQVSAQEARVETVEDWLDLLYNRDDRMIQDGSTRERDTYMVRKDGGTWRIVRDDVVRLSLTTAASPPSDTSRDQEQIRQLIERSHIVYAQALARGGATAQLAQVYAGNRLESVTRLVNARRAAGEYHEVRRLGIQYHSIQVLSAQEARVETTEDWSERVYDRNDRQIEDHSIRARDMYTVRRVGGEWRIVEDMVERAP